MDPGPHRPGGGQDAHQGAWVCGLLGRLVRFAPTSVQVLKHTPLPEARRTGQKKLWCVLRALALPPPANYPPRPPVLWRPPGCPCMQAKEAVVDTPLLMAVGSHQDRVVAKLLEQGHDPMQVGGTRVRVCECT